VGGRLVLPLVFRVRVNGKENFPEGGPLIVVGNHVAVMEAVLMAVYTPWQVEMLASMDVPHERLSALSIQFFGGIEFKRGHVERTAMRQAMGVLEQGGVLGLFPEGGIWDAGAMRPQTGVAWLSYRTATPVLPIGFSGTLGALGAAARLKRPALAMNVGRILPAATLTEGKARKACLEEYALQVVEAIRALVPKDDPSREISAMDERFELEVAARAVDGAPKDVPAALAIAHTQALAKFLHRPAILKIFRTNLKLPVETLQDLEQNQDPVRIAEGVEAILDYLREENPYLLTYRFGPKEAEAMQAGLEELLALARWAADADLSLALTPIRRFFSPQRDEEVVQIKQGEFKEWR
jgi:1-acyl-sn-glycerol-3-phosphate acyltransferase